MEDLIKAYEDRGVKFWVENGQLKFKAPSGTLNAEDKVKLRNVKEKLIEYYERKDKSALKADLSKRYEPFPLTGIQSAYLLGRFYRRRIKRRNMFLPVSSAAISGKCS